MIPQLRTSRRFAITLCVLALLALVVSVTVGHQLEDPLTSGAAATVVLGAFCLIGAGAAIAAVVDAYIQPEGEQLGLATTIAATVFGVLGLLVVIGVIVGATGVVDDEAPAESRSRGGGTASAGELLASTRSAEDRS